ncbi:MAG: hypothetical protein IT379_42315 [Deltaproteobacteria bacterium]|nr:hypothetical protein [Deltaproteobacteria bacterium]
MKIVGVNGALAEVDADADGIAEDAIGLAALGMSDAEREALAGIYSVGDELWRSQLRHFSTWDCNMGLGFPQDAVAPSSNIDGARRSRCTSEASGSRIECEEQVLAQDVALAGSGLGLHYRSDTQVGRQPSRTIVIPLRGSTQALPPSLKRIELTVQVAGRRFDARVPGSGFSAPGPFAPSIPRVTWTWDGRDSFGRQVQGLQTVEIAIDYVYDGRFTVPRRFGDMEPGAVVVGVGAPEPPVTQRLRASLGTWDAQALGLGGWTASPVHLYNPVGREILLGTGRRVYGESLPSQFMRIAGDPSAQVVEPGGPALATRIWAWQQIAPAPDGSVYYVDFLLGSVQRIRPDGILEVVAGRFDEDGFEGDGGPATSALLYQPQGVAVAPDGTVYIADTQNHRVRRVDRDGVITTIAGTGEAEESPDDGPAATIPMLQPRRVVIGPDGSLYVTTSWMIRRIGRDGHSTHLVGCSPVGHSCVAGSEDPDEMQLNQAAATAVDTAGNLYFTNNVNLGDGGPPMGRVFRLSPSGVLTRIAGADCSLDCDPFVPRDTYPGDGYAATDVPLGQPTDVAVARDGSLYVALQSPMASRVIRILPGGTVVTAVGGGSVADLGPGSWPDGTNPLDIEMAVASVAMGPGGSLHVSTYGRVLRLSQALPGVGAGDVVVPAPDGGSVFHFDAAGRLLRAVEPWTGTALYEVAYTALGALASVTDADGNVTAIERDGSGVPLSVTGPYGQASSLAVDTDGYLASITGPGGLEHRFTYSAGGLMATMTDPRGGAHGFDHDAQGRLIADRGPDGGSLTLARTEDPANPEGVYSVSLATAEGRVRSHGVNQVYLGREIRTTTWPDGTSSVTEIRDDGSAVSVAPDGTEVTSASEADPRFGIAVQVPTETIVTLPSGLSVTTSVTRSVTLEDPFNPFSLESFTTSASIDGREYRSEYDAPVRRWIHRSPANRVSTTTLDARGRPIAAQAGSLAPATVSRDARGRLSSVVVGTGPTSRLTTFEYDAMGRLSRVTDPLSRTVVNAFDPSNRLTQQTLPDGRVIGFAYDENGNVTSITPSGRAAHGLTYTPADLLESYAPPMLPGVGATTLSYNRDRQIELVTRPDGSTLDPVYDVAGRVDHTVTPEGVYDIVYSPTSGQVVATTSPFGTSLSFEYDGSLPTATTFGGPIAGTVSRVHDTSLRTSEIRLDGDLVAAYAYDADSLVSRAGSMTLTRDLNGLVESTSLGDTVTVPFYNQFAELVRMVAQHAFADVMDTVYGRDAAGRITRKTETILGTTHVYDYRYDTASRLHEVDTDGALSARYTYDDNSNRVGVLRGGISTTGTVDAQDRLTEWGTQVFTYTPNGELASRLDTATSALTQYGYDSAGALRTVALPSGDSIEYVLDPAGRRIGKRVNGVLEQAWLYQDGLRPIAELDGLGNVVSTFVYATGVNVPDYMVRGGVSYRILRDHLGSVRLVVDVATGTVAQRMEHDEWGRVLVDTAPGFQPFGYAGGLWDPDTGLVHFGAREYDAETGRWTSKDPIGFGGGDANLFGYTAADPINQFDPTGLDYVREGTARPVWRRMGELLSALWGGDDVSAIVSLTTLLVADDNWEPETIRYAGATSDRSGVDWNMSLEQMTCPGAAAIRRQGQLPGEYLAGKNPTHVTPGIRTLRGTYVDDLGRAQPWTAHYDEYGRIIARTDYNAANRAHGIPAIHHHRWEYNARFPMGRQLPDHFPGEYTPGQ